MELRWAAAKPVACTVTSTDRWSTGACARRLDIRPCALPFWQSTRDVSATASVPGRLNLCRLGRELLCRILVCLRPSEPDPVALDQVGPECSRGDVQLLGQLRDDGKSERPGPSPWPAFANADSKVLYIGDPITVGGVANINGLTSFDAVYTTVRGKPFAAR